MNSRSLRYLSFATSGPRVQCAPGALSEPFVGPRADTENRRLYRLVLCLWFLFLFEPARLIASFVHALSPLQWIPEILLYAGLFLWVFSPAPKRHLKWFTAFFALTLLGTVIAFLFGNWGFSRYIVRLMFQYYGLGILTLAFCDTPQRAGAVLRLYFFSFLYYGIWGLISLKTSPIVDNVDPGFRQIVYWHHHFSNRDGFGPLMAMGFAFSFYFYKTAMKRLLKLLVIGSMVLCVVGIVISFGRGVFLAFIAAIGYIWFKEKHKLFGAIALVAIAFAFVHFAPKLADRYLETMETIFSEGTSGGTGLDRKLLWGWAWREFLSSPVFGVGTGNFGIAIFRILGYGELYSWGYTDGQLWGKCLHCAPMTVLCEYGVIGAGVMLFLLADFVRTNRQTRKNAIRFAGPPEQNSYRNGSLFQPSALVATSDGLSATFLTILVSAFFYELLYTPLLWHLVIINRLVYLVSLEAEGHGESRLA